MSSPVEVRLFEFNRLPEPVRRRLIGVTAGGDPKCVILHRDAPPRRGVRWGLLGAGLVALAILLVTRPEGVFDPWSSVWVYGLVAAPLGFGLALSVRGIFRRREWPLTPGKYLFEYGYVELADGKVTLIPNDALERSHIVNDKLVLGYRGNVLCSLGGPDVAEGRVELDAALEQLPRRSADELAVLNPLHGADEGTTAVTYRWRRVPGFAGLVPALLAGSLLTAGLGAGALRLHNDLTEAGLFAAAQAQDTVQSWEAYARAGGERTYWAVTERIPEIVFTSALAADSATSMQEFLDAYPDSVHAEEARAFIAEAEAEAEAAAEAKAAAEAPPPKPEALAAARGRLDRRTDLVVEERALIEAVHAWCEAVDGPCVGHLVSSGPGDAELAKLDAKLERLRATDEGLIVPTHLALQDLQAHGHRRLMAKLVWRLEQVLGFDLLELADHGAAFEPLTEPRPDGLFVHAQWVFDSDGKVFRGADDPTAFADVEVRVLITVEVPGLEEALTIRLRSETGEELTVREKRLPHVDAGRRADSVYGSIIRHSVASLETELERALDPEASARPIAWGRERLKP